MVDVIPFEAAHAQQLLGLDTGALIAISSASVYADDEGRTLDEAEGVDDFPELPVPIPETQATVEPGYGTYSTKKVALERILLENGDVPGSDRAALRDLRPGRPDGTRVALREASARRQAARHPHEQRRGTLPHDRLGEHRRARPPARCTAGEERRVNCGDPDPPSVLEIARATGEAAGHSFDEVLLPEPGRQTGSRPDAVVDAEAVPRRHVQSRAELGYRPAVRWAEALPRQVEWLIGATRGRDWREVLPRGANYLRFDYEAEDTLCRGWPSTADEARAPARRRCGV